MGVIIDEVISEVVRPAPPSNLAPALSNRPADAEDSERLSAN